MVNKISENDNIKICGILGILSNEEGQAIESKEELERLIGVLRKART